MYGAPDLSFWPAWALAAISIAFSSVDTEFSLHAQQCPAGLVRSQAFSDSVILADAIREL